MNYLKKVALFAVATVFLSSCTKDVDENLVGSWDGKLTQGVFGFTVAVDADYTFREDGTATSTTFMAGESDTDDFLWSAAGDKVSIFEDGYSEAVDFEVIENKRNHIELKATETFMEDGVTFTTEIDLVLDRK